MKLPENRRDLCGATLTSRTPKAQPLWQAVGGLGGASPIFSFAEEVVFLLFDLFGDFDFKAKRGFFSPTILLTSY